MSLLEILLGALVAALVAAAGFFQAWRGVKRREREAEAWGKAVAETLDHAKRTHAAGQVARQAGEKQVEAVREQVREGRRDHFEAQ